MQVARLDYKPLVLDHDNNGDPYDSMMAVQTDIQDFEGTIAYQIDTNFGNCSIVPINKDLAGDLNVADGRIQSPDPMHVFFMDQKFAYNGIHKERGIKMDYFTTEIQSSTDEDFYWDMVVGLTASQYLVQEDGKGGRLLPGQIVRYPKNSYNDLSKRITYNIFRFTKSKAQFQDYNIMPCFADTDLMHVLVKMSWNMAMDFQAVEELQRYARTALKTTMEITALRVQDIELLLRKSEGQFDLIFSLTPPPNVEHLGIELPAPAFRPLDECFQKLQDAVNNGTFSIFIPANEGGVDITTTASSLIKLARRSDGGGIGPKVSYSKGYSSGDMAGLAFGMIFGGMLLAGVFYFFALRNNVRAGIPVMRGFDNPLTGLTNLVTNK